jgi:hypothetical protein
VPCDLPPIHQKAGPQPVSDIGTKKDAQTGQVTVEGGRAEAANTCGGGSGDAANGQVTRGTIGPDRSCAAD